MPRPRPRASRTLTATILLASAALLAVIGLAPAPVAAAAVSTSDRLTTGQSIGAGASLVAAGSEHRLTVGTDGDVTVRLGSGPVLWHTGTTGNPGARLVQATSGALEVRTGSGTVLWTTGAASPGARSIIKPDGVLYSVDTAGRLVWKSTTDGPALKTTGTDRVPSGGLVLAGESIASGDVRLTMGVDGDLVLTRAGTVAWRTGTATRGALARVTTAGELQVVAGDTVLWSSGPASAASAGARLVVKDHARIYLVSTAGTSLWSSPAPTAERVPAVVTLPLPAALPVPTRPGSGGGTRPDTGTGERVYRTVLSAAPQYADPTSEPGPGRHERRGGRPDHRRRAARQGGGRRQRPLARDRRRHVHRARLRRGREGRRPDAGVRHLRHPEPGLRRLLRRRVRERRRVPRLGGRRRRRPAGVRRRRRRRARRAAAPRALRRPRRAARDDPVLRRGVRRRGRGGLPRRRQQQQPSGGAPSSLRDMALRLRAAGVDRAAGFSTNVSNFQRTDHEVAYGTYLSALLGGKAFVVDTSRNGNGPLAGPDGTVWCNPDGRALGPAPAATGTGPHVANLWIKTVGRSDGTCNGGPAAGAYWESYVLGLAERAAW